MPVNATVRWPKSCADGRKVVVDWDQLLIAPELLKTGGGDPYRAYGPFLRNWRGQVLAKQPGTVAVPTGLMDLDPAQAPTESLPTLRETHGFKGAEICPCRPGGRGSGATHHVL